MKLLIFIGNTYQIYQLPFIVDGNFWVTVLDNDGVSKNILNVFSYNDTWVYEGENGKIVLECYHSYSIFSGGVSYSFYTMPIYDETLNLYSVSSLNQVTVGFSHTDISYPLFSDAQLSLVKKGKSWLLQTSGQIPLYINRVLTTGKLLENGDHLFFQGFEMYFLADFFVINNPLGNVNILNKEIVLKQIRKVVESNEELDIVSIYKKSDYFYRSPRFRNVINPISIRIDAPPGTFIQEELPILLQMGSMLTMGMSSTITLFLAVSGVVTGEKNIKDTWPSLLIGGSMLVGMLLIPTLTRRYQKKQTLKKEKIRQERYLAYLANKKQEIHQIMEDQQRALNENSVSLSSCEDIILHRRRNLWERKIEHDDFLMVHIGIGDIPAKINFQFPEEHFSLDDDNLKEEVFKMASEPRTLKNVPINISFVEKNICAILGNIDLIPSFLNTIILQFITFHSYEDLKFVIFTSKDNSCRFEGMKDLPFLWNNNRSMRYYGETKEDIFSISMVLYEELKKRKFQDGDNGRESSSDYRSFLPYYVIITDDFSSIRDNEFIKSVLKSKVNYGFSFLIINQRLMGLPNECNSFINVDLNQSGMIENELDSDKQLIFQAEFLNKSLDRCYHEICNIPIEFKEEQGSMPESVSFLEMYNVGKVEQLNILNRWSTNNSYDTLKAPVGINQNGGIFYLDLHEKEHGPHGLVAGMTGSGKSEFIISYILSMAINYHPDDVSFVLIDYKGGGLAGAFENRETGVKLPHLAGTITNLDTVEIKRSLASIESELKRRQRLFNEAREQTNESTINIYKYQKLYHDGIVKIAIPHLFIISDEFAELKSQQPEFMTQLISTARIGRSLGVHLILATQKPSGVVDAQIWSNSKFRVCLKVQDRSDSMDMLKVPDAASLSVVGRFYLQVGYNEYFAMGQSAWCGAPYYEMDERKKKINSSIDFINSTGQIVKSLEQENEFSNLQFKGEELPNILNYISQVADRVHARVSPLWLPSIDETIYISDLEKKYSYQRKPFLLDEIIGEYDDPSTQSQFLLTLPITLGGNTLVYGSAGSGKENFLQTFLYSSITHHTPEEVNFYILDFGAEILRSFQDAPHVGDVVFSSMDEKVTNLFKFLDEMLEKRKKLFADYNGSFVNYNEKSSLKVPNIVVIINNYENFKELFETLEDQLSILTREGSKFGIFFIITLNGVSSARVRLTQNFKQIISLQLNNNEDYSMVLGNVNRIYPSKKFGRGILKLEGNVYEFQTASIYAKGSVADFIKAVCQKYSESYKVHALNIPVLPERVYLTDEMCSASSLSNFIVGIYKDTLSYAQYDFTNRVIHNVLADDISKLSKFTLGIIRELQHLTSSFYIFDNDELLNSDVVNYANYFNDNICNAFLNFYQTFTKLNDLSSEEKKKSESFVLIIIGVENFFKRIVEYKDKFSDMISLGSETEKLVVLFVDSADSIKTIESESWYRSDVSTNQGIWVSSGITDQYSIKLSKTPRFCYEEIPLSFGYIVKKGVPSLVKVLEEEINNE